MILNGVCIFMWVYVVVDVCTHTNTHTHTHTHTDTHTHKQIQTPHTQTNTQTPHDIHATRHKPIHYHMLLFNGNLSEILATSQLITICNVQHR